MRGAYLPVHAVAGNIAPKLPFNRYVGFRLPWTVTDEDTWIFTHRLVVMPLCLWLYSIWRGCCQAWAISRL